MTVMYFPAERAVFAVDFIFPGTTPPVWGEYDWTPLREWIASIKTVEALDFDILIPGHGRRLGNKADVVANREFLEDLSAAVSKGIAEGKSLDELKKTVTLEKYSMWPNLATARLSNIENAYTICGTIHKAPYAHRSRRMASRSESTRPSALKKRSSGKRR